MSCAALEANVELVLRNLLKSGIAKAFTTIPTPDVLLAPNTRKKVNFDYQCNNAMSLAKILQQQTPPISMTAEEVAKAIVSALPISDAVDNISATSQGFITIGVSATWAARVIQFIFREGLKAPPPPTVHQQVLVDFSSPNIAKEMHVGHLRSTILGESICRLHEFCGYKVRRINHVGDWGTQFGMLICYLKEQHPNFLTTRPPISDLVTFYKTSKKKFDEDPIFKEKARQEVVKLQALDEENIKAWRLLCDISRKEFQEVYDRLGITIEERGESFYNPFIPDVIKLLESEGMTEQHDGALIVRSRVVKKLTDLDAMDVSRLLSGEFLQAKKDGAHFCHPKLEEVLRNAKLLVNTDGTDMIHLNKKEIKPWKQFDVAKDIEKLAKAMEPLYFKPAPAPSGKSKSKNQEKAKENKTELEKTNEGENQSGDTTNSEKKTFEVHSDLVNLFREAGLLITTTTTTNSETQIKIPRFSFPLMLKKSDGGYTYDTTDVTAFWHRFTVEKNDKVLYVTDAGQAEHFRMCGQLAEDMGWLKGEKEWSHIGFGLVCGDDGRKFKTRSSETVKLQSLLDEAYERAYKTLCEREAATDASHKMSDDEMKQVAKKIGYGAVKYFDLKQCRTTNYIFNYDRMLDQSGNTAVYMLYTYARIRSIQRKANVSDDELQTATVLLQTPQEKALALFTLRFHSVLLRTLVDYMVHHITDYVYELSQRLSDFYGACRVLGSEEQMSRLVLLSVVASTIKSSLMLLGIETSDRL